MKKYTLIFLVILLSFGFLSCNKESTDTLITETTTTTEETSLESNTDLELPEVSDLINDDFAVGNYYGDSGISRIPLDEAYQLLISRKNPLEVGETYVEDFEANYLNSKIYPYKSDDGAEFSFVSNIIDGKSLVLNSLGDYAGIYLNGMKYSANSSYQISFDYRILSGANEFFLQFRSLNGGVSSDVYVNVSSENNLVNSYSFQADLGNYNDYELMIFPRFDCGIVAIDNLSITRIDSKPIVKNYEILGNLEVDSELSISYDFYDSEGQLEGDTSLTWFSSLDEFGKNKELLAMDTTTLTVTEDMLGKYIICEIVPFSTGESATNNVGSSVYAVSERLVGTVVTEVDVILEANETFTEDFENDITEVNNLFFNEIDHASAYIQTSNDNKELKLFSDTAFGGLEFSGINFEMNKVYNISFDYTILEMPSNIYAQMRSDNGGMKHDKYIDINLTDKDLNTEYHFSGDFGLDAYSDYYIMLFFGIIPGSIVIDNICIEDLDQVNYEVNSIELNVGEYIYEDFDSSNRYLGFDYAQVPNSLITDDETFSISGNSLYFESSGNYLCLFINQGLIYTPQATYRVSFDYNIIQFSDTLYFQFNGGAYGNVFTEFGDNQTLNEINSFTYDFELSETSNYVMQIFPGQTQGNTIIVIDNIKIERIN